MRAIRRRAATQTIVDQVLQATPGITRMVIEANMNIEWLKEMPQDKNLKEGVPCDDEQQHNQ